MMYVESWALVEPSMSGSHHVRKPSDGGKGVTMQTFEVYYAPACSCDSEWKLLGEVQAADTVAALEQAAQRWNEYPQEFLVIVKCSAPPVPVTCESRSLPCKSVAASSRQ